MTIPAVFRVTLVSRGDEAGQLSRAEVVYDVDISIAHPRFAYLSNVMKTKAVRGEVEAYRANAKEYLELADSLIENGLCEIEDNLKRKLGWLGTILGWLVFSALVLGYFHWVGAVVTGVLAVPVIWYAWTLKKRYDTVYNWGCEMLEDFDKRLEANVAQAFPPKEDA